MSLNHTRLPHYHVLTSTPRDPMLRKANITHLVLRLMAPYAIHHAVARGARSEAVEVTGGNQSQADEKVRSLKVSTSAMCAWVLSPSFASTSGNPNEPRFRFLGGVSRHSAMGVHVKI